MFNIKVYFIKIIVKYCIRISVSFQLKGIGSEGHRVELHELDGSVTFTARCGQHYRYVYCELQCMALGSVYICADMIFL